MTPFTPSVEFKPTKDQVTRIDELVAHYEANKYLFTTFASALTALVIWPSLSKYVHSFKFRVKEPGHLRGKLLIKLQEALKDGRNGEEITTANLFREINDLAGLRILHLYTGQMEHIHTHLMAALAEYRYELMEKPFARTWDNERTAYFKKLGIETQESPSMYTSVHYVVQANRQSGITGEIQVRTLAEELWGEVDHTINYPVPSPKLTVKEQIRVLARATSACTRLVDSIFIAHEEGRPAGESVKEKQAPPPVNV